MPMFGNKIIEKQNKLFHPCKQMNSNYGKNYNFTSFGTADSTHSEQMMKMLKQIISFLVSCKTAHLYNPYYFYFQKIENIHIILSQSNPNFNQLSLSIPQNNTLSNFIISIYQQLYLQQMNGQSLDEIDSLISSKQPHNPQLISIRKKLIAPNKILPGIMIRSQLPIHLIPVQSDFQSTAGHQMPLDTYDSNSDLDQNQRIKISRSRDILNRQRKQRGKKQLQKHNKKEEYSLIDCHRVANKTNLQITAMPQFLNKDIRNLLAIPEKIAFISKTAFISNTNLQKNKLNKLTDNHTIQQKKLAFINYLNDNKYFATTPYAFDHKNKQEQFNHLPSFPNTDELLEFDDNFQSSNLYMAVRGDQEMDNVKRENQKYVYLYLLAVRLDYNTKSYGQWFNFKVKRKSSPFSFSRNGNNLFKFRILNMTKNSSLFGKGLKISVCRKGIWKKQGQNIKYQKNNLRRYDQPQPQPFQTDQTIITNTQQPQTYFSLQFTLQIFDQQQLYISYNQPYTYTRLGKLLDNITNKYENNIQNIIEFKRSILCNTYLNNHIEVLTFTATPRISDSQSSVQKPVIFIMGRTHPVQTAGSHVIEGILNQLYRLFIEHPSQEYKNHIIFQLLQNYIIKIIPMVNPDGVILGNSRCNISGYDLNRSWKMPKLQKTKEIFYIKKHILQYQKRIQMFIDLHAHSKKKNVFAYGCHDISNPYSTREFPYLLSKLSQNDFLFQQCRFTKFNCKQSTNHQNKLKEGTARIFLYDTLKIPNIFTIQNSYCSAKNSVFHYDKSSYSVIGADILKAISLYFSPFFNKNNDWNTPEQKKRYSNQSRIEVSLNTTINDISLKVTINSDMPTLNKQKISEEIYRYRNPNQIRQKYLFELHQKEENVTVGLLKDNQVSDSQQEQRIYETSRKKYEKLKTEGSSLKKHKQQSKTQKLINYIHKNGRNESRLASNNKTQISKTNSKSEASIIRISKMTKTKFHTINKPIEFPPQMQDEETDQYILSRRQKYLLKKPVTPRKKKQFQSQMFRISKKDNFLSIVEIGLGKQIQHMTEYRQNIIDKIDLKNKVKPTNSVREQKCDNSQRKHETSIEYSQISYFKKEDQIKEYMRKLIKPKHNAVEKKQRIQRLGKYQKIETNSKSSAVQFPPELRLSKIIEMQRNKRIRVETERKIY